MIALHAWFAIGIAGLIGLSSMGLGLGVLSLIASSLRDRPVIKLIMALGVGSGVLSLTTFVLGLTGKLERGWVIGVLAIGILGGGPEFVRMLFNMIHAIKGMPLRPGWYAIGLVMIAGLAILNSLVALLPPTDIDTLNYHLSVPHIYALQHRIIPIPSIYFSYFPFNVQMLYTLCLVLGSAQAAQLLHVGFGLGNVLVIMMIARHYYGVRTAILAGVVFYTLNDVGMETPLARVDLGVSLYALLAFWCFLMAQRERSVWQWVGMSGVFAGLCAGSKYTGLIAPGVLGMVMLGSLRGTIWRKLLLVLLMGGVAALVAAPWYLRNYLWTGNPCFPFLTNLFGQGTLTLEEVQALQQGNWDYAPVARTFANFLALPWLLLVQREAFASGRIGPLFLAYVPIFLAVRWRRLRRLWPILLFCGLWLPFWFWTSPLVRFLFAPLGLLCVLVAQALRLALRYRKIWRFLTLGVLWGWLSFMGLWHVKNYLPLVPFALGVISPEIFLEHTDLEGYHYRDFHYVNTTLQPNKLLLFGSHGLYITGPFTLAADWAAQHADIVQRCDLLALTTALQQSGITHSMFSQPFATAHPLERTLFQCYQAAGLASPDRVVYEAGKVSIVQLHRVTAPLPINTYSSER